MVIFLLSVLIGWSLIYYIARFLWELIPVGNLNGKSVLITGCDSGFGRMLALKLCSKGLRVFAACLTEKGEDSIRKSAIGLTGTGLLETVSLDITDEISVHRALNTVQMHLKEDELLWALVNNAGVFSCYGPDDWLTVDEYRKSIEVNLLGMIRMTQTFKPLLKQSRGRIVTVTSVCGRLSVHSAAPYSVAKYGAEAYMDAVRQELYHFGVTCCIVEPAGYKTALLDEDAHNARVDSTWNTLPFSVRDEYGQDYKDIFKQSWNRAMHKFVEGRLEDVTEAYEHAICGRFPRFRYRCGWTAILLWIPISFMPTALADFLLRLGTQSVEPKPILPAALRKAKKCNSK